MPCSPPGWVSTIAWSVARRSFWCHRASPEDDADIERAVQCFDAEDFVCRTLTDAHGGEHHAVFLTHDSGHASALVRDHIALECARERVFDADDEAMRFFCSCLERTDVGLEGLLGDLAADRVSLRELVLCYTTAGVACVWDVLKALHARSVLVIGEVVALMARLPLVTLHKDGKLVFKRTDEKWLGPQRDDTDSDDDGGDIH